MKPTSQWFTNRTDIAPTAVGFILNKLEQFDLTKLDEFKLLPLNRIQPFHGLCTYPKRTAKRSRTFEHQYKIRCSVNIRRDRWPVTIEEGIGTWSKVNGGQRLWGWITEKVTYASVEEAAVFVAGHEAFHFLRCTRQVEGRNTQAQANAYGIAWLKEFRKETC